MNLSKKLFKTPLVVPNSLVIFVLIVALVGFADATFLTIEHYQNVIPPCTTSGCETVLTSAYATIAGIPVSLLGAIYYLFILISAAVYFVENKSTKLLRYGLLITVIGFLMSLYFFYLQAFVIHSYCQYCLVSALTSTLLFIAACVVFGKYTKEPEVI